MLNPNPIFKNCTIIRPKIGYPNCPISYPNYPIIQVPQFFEPSSNRIPLNLDQDFKLLEATGGRTPRLEKLLQALLSLKPTSTVCEQAFSVGGYFKTKIRNRLSNEKLNALTWLKYFFAKPQL